MRPLVAVGAGLAVVGLVMVVATTRHGTEGTPPAQAPAKAPSGTVIGDPVAVAVRFLEALTPRVLLDPAERTAVLHRWSDASAEGSLRRAYAIEADRVRATYGGPPRVSRSALLGYRLERQGAGRATVAIWAVGLAAGRTGTGASGWSTVAVTLRRRTTAWRVAAVAYVAGPDPSQPAAELAHAAASFRPFAHAR
jgi:hypothetical protein